MLQTKSVSSLFSLAALLAAVPSHAQNLYYGTYVAAGNETSIFQVTPSGAQSTALQLSGYDPVYGITFDPVGNMYYATNTDIYKVADVNGHYGTPQLISFGYSLNGSYSGVDGPKGMVYSGGYLYVNALRDSPNVVRIATDGSDLLNPEPFYSGSTFYDTPQGGMAIDSKGDVYISAVSNITGRPEVYEFASENGNLNDTPSEFASPLAVYAGPLAFDTQGDLFAADGSNNGVVFEYKSTAGVLSNVGTDIGRAFGDPRQIALDSSGDLYYAGAESNVVKYTTTGGALNQVYDISNLFSNEALAISPAINQTAATPEPGTFSLFTGVGVAGIAFAFRLRRRRSLIL